MSKGRRRKRVAKRQEARPPAGDRSTAAPAEPAAPRGGHWRSKRIVLVGLLALAALAALALLMSRRGGSDLKEFQAAADRPLAVLGSGDEPRVREVCSNCHQFPSPRILPRSAWNSTIWQMFQQSGYGTTAKWPLEPEAVVAWYESRAPEMLTLPETPEDHSRPTKLPLVKRAILAAQGDADPVVSNIVVADVVGDARPELVACEMLSGKILLGRGGETDWQFERIAEVDNPAHVEVADLDADGRADLIVADLGSYLAMDHNLGSVVWLRQLEDGTFEQITLRDGLGRVADVQPSDLDGDGDLDLIVAEFGWRTTGHVWLLENRTPAGQPLVLEPREIDRLHGASHVDVADLNGDGLRDIVALYSQGQEMVRCYVRHEEDYFEIRHLYRAPHPAWGFTGSQLTDLDGDGDLDILLTNGDTFDNNILKPYHGVQWLENRGKLTFAPRALATLYGAYRAEAADLDGDGDADIVACALTSAAARQASGAPDSLDSLVWLEQTEPGEFVRHVLESGPCDHPTLTVGDYDLDGDVDVLVGNGQLHLSVAAAGRNGIDLWENQTLQPPDGSRHLEDSP